MTVLSDAALPARYNPSTDLPRKVWLAMGTSPLQFVFKPDSLGDNFLQVQGPHGPKQKKSRPLHEGGIVTLCAFRTLCRSTNSNLPWFDGFRLG
jgi:hypothetical protein